MPETDRLLDRLNKKLCDEYELYVREVETTAFEVKDGQRECYTTSRSNGISLRILKNGSFGFAYSTQFTPDAYEQLVTVAASSARFAGSDEHNGFAQASSFFPRPDVHDAVLAAIPLEEKTAVLAGIEEEARSYDRRITRVRKLAYHEHRASEKLITSSGLRLQDSDTLVSCSISLVAESQGDSQSGWDFSCSRLYRELDTTSLASAAGSKAIALLGARPVSSFRGQVLLDRSVACQFLGLLAHSFLADAVQKNRSLFCGKMNTAVCAPGVHITDDSLYPGGMATRSFDGEGVPGRTTPIIENGILTRYLYDTYSARKEKTESTGNSSRVSLKVPPRPACSNLYLHNGTCSVDEMTARVSQGLFVSGVLGMHTANPITGDFSVGIDGLLIINGRLASPVKGMALSGNILALYRNVICIGNDLRFYGTLGSPSILIADMEVSGN